MTDRLSLDGTRSAMTAQVFGEDESGLDVAPYSQVFVVYGGMVALVATPVVEQRFDKQLGGYVEGRGAARGFAADSIMQLTV